MMRGDSHADHDDCHSGCCNKSSQAKPVSRPPETSRFVADVSYHIAGEEWRKNGLGNAAQNIPLYSWGFKETFKLSDTSRMPHFAQRLGFDLTDPLAGNLKLSAYLLQRSAISVD